MVALALPIRPTNSSAPLRRAHSACRSSGMAIFVYGIVFGVCCASFAFLFFAQHTVLRRSLQSGLPPPLSFFHHPPRSPSLPPPSGQGRQHIDDGWRSIDVYVGAANATELYVAASTISRDVYSQSHWFSQNRQDEIVATLLRHKTHGYFVDLAANDAVKISNTYALEHFYHWHGLCLEPNSVYWSGLALLRPRCQVAGAVAGQRTGETISFKFPINSPGPKGGIVGFSFDNQNASQHHGEDQPRITISLSDIFDRYQVPSVIDYMSLDIEGAETFVLSQFDFERYRFRVLTIERPSAELQQLLERYEYVLLRFLKEGRESLWAHQREMDDLDVAAANHIDTANFSYRKSRARAGVATKG